MTCAGFGTPEGEGIISIKLREKLLQPFNTKSVITELFYFKDS